MKRRRSILLLGALGLTVAATSLWVHRRRLRARRQVTSSTLTLADRLFLGYAIALEAQQIRMYGQLYSQAQADSELESGLHKAMVMEDEHLIHLQQEARRHGLSTAPLAVLGKLMGRLSGSFLKRFDPRVALRAIVLIERRAARDYAKARRGLGDQRLATLYQINQGDEELHVAWARSMLR